MNLKQAVKDKLNAGEKITMKWDCGNDEALVYVAVNGKQMSYSEDFASEIDMHVLNLLDLPSAGEFSMEGKGEIIEENGKIFLKCESKWKGYYDYEVNDWVEDDGTIDGEYSGKFELFEE